MNDELIQQALIVGAKYPVFPTNQKIPCWSNKDLDLPAGQGGYKIATQDPDEIRRLFSHKNATEIAVPMGTMSGLLCVDVDLYKGEGTAEWMADNQHWLGSTRAHKTRSGGVHYIFKHVTGERFPATIAPGVDIKAGGTGFVCWPPTKGYSLFNKKPIKSLPIPEFKAAHQYTNKMGSTTTGSFNDASDADLIARVREADELYPALRTLSFRLPTRRKPDGGFLTIAEQVSILTNVMRESKAMDPAHPRHSDWLDRMDKVQTLVDSANKKNDTTVEVSDRALDVINAGDAFIETQKIIAASVRPVGPQAEVTVEQIEQALSEDEDDEPDPDYHVITAQSTRAKTLEPIKWIVNGMIPEQSTVSLGGTSNVGKTRWLASLVTALAVGDTIRMGLPSCKAAVPSLWFANEERAADIERRIKAVVLQNADTDSLPMVVRGKDTGMMRLVALNELGNPEIDMINVTRIVKQSRRIDAKIIIFDPYVTLSDAMDENSAVSAGTLTRAFIMIASLTGAAVLHAHHTPKDRSKDGDWYRADSGAWRGSGAIYSALDCGYTLSPWMPKNSEERKQWRNKTLDLNLGRWVVLDTGKIREGAPLEPIIYELTGQEMAEGEGADIGVCTLRSEAEAANVLLDADVDKLEASELAEEIGDTLGLGKFSKLSEIHAKMQGQTMWPVVGDRMFPRDMVKLHVMFKVAVHWSGGIVRLVLDENKKTNGRWTLIVE
tara:strand:- start:3621 stop:5780 length:2160 start_codon:yes stop_codon:yes gene_type:complete